MIIIHILLLGRGEPFGKTAAAPACGGSRFWRKTRVREETEERSRESKERKGVNLLSFSFFPSLSFCVRECLSLCVYVSK